jgi:hypothetical protein
VRDRRSLLDWATSAVPGSEIEIDLNQAIDQIKADLDGADGLSAKAVEQRRRELLAIKRLMEQGFGMNWSGRGSVRLIPRSRVL